MTTTMTGITTMMMTMKMAMTMTMTMIKPMTNTTATFQNLRGKGHNKEMFKQDNRECKFINLAPRCFRSEPLLILLNLGPRINESVILIRNA